LPATHVSIVIKLAVQFESELKCDAFVCPITKLSITELTKVIPDRYSNETRKIQGDHAKTAEDREDTINLPRL
jgi:hypothetical protein